MFRIIICICAVWFLVGCSNQQSETEPVVLTISAASSLKDVLEETETLFLKEHDGISLQFNFAASGTLAKQIEQGAPVDLFISASEDHFAELKDAGFIESEMQLAKNELVLIAASTSDLQVNNFSDLLEINLNKLAIGTPDVVPAGTYSQQALTYYHVWGKMQNQLIYTKDVRQVLSYVETKNVDMGIVYKTDALVSEKVKIVASASEESHDEIMYPAGVIKSTKHPKEAQAYYEFLKSDEMKQLLSQYGFIVNRE
ncbi:MAG: molybdate ABC transporter substrate-binding protein [Bacillus sp. (in: firmicutes)]